MSIDRLGASISHACICGGTNLAVRLNSLLWPLEKPQLYRVIDRHKKCEQNPQRWYCAPMEPRGTVLSGVWLEAELFYIHAESRFSEHSTYCSAFDQVSKC